MRAKAVRERDITCASLSGGRSPIQMTWLFEGKPTKLFTLAIQCASDCILAFCRLPGTHRCLVRFHKIPRLNKRVNLSRVASRAGDCGLFKSDTPAPSLARTSQLSFEPKATIMTGGHRSRTHPWLTQIERPVARANCHRSPARIANSGRRAVCRPSESSGLDPTRGKRQHRRTLRTVRTVSCGQW